MKPQNNSQYSSTNHNLSSDPSISNEELSIHTVEEDINDQHQPEHSMSIDISQLMRKEAIIFPELQNFKSKNQQNINRMLEERARSMLVQEKMICMQGICFSERRNIQMEEDHLHECHKIVKISQLLKDLYVLKCNSSFTTNNPQEVISLLNSLDNLYHEILVFQQEITGLFNQLKISARQHITTVKQSFSFKYYEQMRDDLLQDFTYSNVKYALDSIQKFKKINYPDLQYPKLKIKNMKNIFQKINLKHKINIIQDVNRWVQKLFASHKTDPKIRKNRSINTFMNMNPSQTQVFSLYMKSNEYKVTENGKSLVRQNIGQDFVPIAVIEKQLTNYAQIKIKIEKMKNSIFIGFCQLKQLEANQYQNVVKGHFSHFITNNGTLLPIGSQNQNLKSIPFKFGQHDVISIIRSNSFISFVKNAHQKYPQKFEIHLSPEEYMMSLYPCFHLQSTSSLIKIIK